MEYIKYAFTGVNILSSSLILIIIFYWLMTIIGFFSIDSFNPDIDLDNGNIELNDISIKNKLLKEDY